MIYLLQGEDKSRLEKRVAELSQTPEDTTGLNLVSIESPFEFGAFKNAIETLPFLADKKVVIAKNIFVSKDKTFLKNLLDYLPTIPEYCELIIVEDVVIKSQYIKSLGDKVRIETYNPLSPRETTQWITARTKELGGNISAENAERLSAAVGSDLVRAENEIRKLISYDPNISRESLNDLVTPDFNESIFSLVDAISTKNTKSALKLLSGFMDNEENEIYLLTMLARQVRNLLIVKDLSANGKNEAAIASETGLHPFVVKKAISQSRNFSIENLIELHESLIESDLALKTTSGDAKIILSRLVARFAS